MSMDNNELSVSDLSWLCKQAVEFLNERKGITSVEEFDDAFAPHGVLLREFLSTFYVVSEDAGGFLKFHTRRKRYWLLTAYYKHRRGGTSQYVMCVADCHPADWVLDSLQKKDQYYHDPVILNAVEITEEQFRRLDGQIG